MESASPRVVESLGTVVVPWSLHPALTGTKTISPSTEELSMGTHQLPRSEFTKKIHSQIDGAQRLLHIGKHHAQSPCRPDRRRSRRLSVGREPMSALDVHAFLSPCRARMCRTYVLRQLQDESATSLRRNRQAGSCVGPRDDRTCPLSLSKFSFGYSSEALGDDRGIMATSAAAWTTLVVVCAKPRCLDSSISRM
ncbi:hypothetical protein K458DRAFT_3118 [Lentithecium fluviatile CBS 122367]|uniref:Uncharacterized protein n=1 Tax=Lentithecium fluviatile CBS 122367 TaxID=1168545 RepID=A0A6G1JM07_9PLEO|nr:hypothetical protein K458DRAFT_3118 [Lentithecium fluviatile CBS 122367]